MTETPAQKALRTRRAKIDGPATKREAVAYAMSRGARCLECPLYDRGEGPAPSRPDVDDVRPARLMVIGPEPSRDDILEGRVMRGPGAKVIRQAFRDHLGKGDSEPVSRTNVVLCRPVTDGGSLKLFQERLSREHSAAKREAAKQWRRDGKMVAGIPTKKPPEPERKPTPVECCRPRLDRDIKDTAPHVILSLGAHAMESVGEIYGVPTGGGKKQAAGDLRLATLGDQQGHPFDLPGGPVLWPAADPSMALNAKPDLLAVIEHCAAKAIDVARRIDAGGPRIDERPAFFEYVPKQETPKREVFRALADFAREYAATAQASGRLPVLTCDIETEFTSKSDPDAARIRCVGLGYTHEGREYVIVVPTRYKNGKAYWPKKSRPRVLALLRAMINGGTAWAAVGVACADREATRVAFHNGMFDVRHLARNGIWQDLTDAGELRTWIDTLVMHKNSRECSLPHRLAFVSARFLEVVLWKGDVDHKAADNDQADGDLWTYNAKDVLTQDRIRPPEVRWIREDGTAAQMKKDQLQLPIARLAGDLGFCVHEESRREAEAQLRTMVDERREEIQELTGQLDFNPNSPQQVASYLYDKLGYTPPPEKGVSWTEGDKQKTDIPTLIELIRSVPQEADPHLWDFVFAQIKYKSYAKQLSGYIEPWGELPWCPGHEGVLRRLRTQYKLTIASGRWASSPNLQNIPKMGALNLRKILRPPPGHVFVTADYDQLELRLFAEETGNQRIIDAVKNGMDPHSLNAAMMHAASEAEMWQTYEGIIADKKSDDKERQARAGFIRLHAKVTAFSMQYGAGKKTLFRSTATARNKATGERLFPDYTEAVNARCFDNFHRLNPQCRVWHAAIDAEVGATGKISDMFRQRWRFFRGGLTTPNEPRNHRIQATASECASDAVLELVRRIPFGRWSPETGFSIFVHDELGLTVPEDHAEEASTILEECMYRELSQLALTGEAEIQREWTGENLRAKAT